MNISNVKVYDMDESLTAAGYPLSLNTEECSADLKRGSKLGSVKTGTGHDNYLSGILVSFDIKYPQYLTPQLQRYNFIKIVSSQSKMHRIMKMNIETQCNEYVTAAAIENLNNCIEEYNHEQTRYRFMRVISNVPMGLELTMRCTTNYLQLKTIYQQRHNHLLEDWSKFCNWILTLDKFKELCLNTNKS